jgi:hypothetical protein
MVWMTILGSFELNLEKNELNKGHGTISFVKDSYDTIDRFHRPTKYQPCIDVILNDHQPYIRLSTDYEKHKEVFRNLKVENREVTYLYYNWRFHGYKIYNPAELTVGGQKIIDFDLERKNEIWGFLVFVTLDLFVLMFLVVAISTYREQLIIDDKKLIIDRKFLKLLGKWWDD